MESPHPSNLQGSHFQANPHSNSRILSELPLMCLTSVWLLFQVSTSWLNLNSPVSPDFRVAICSTTSEPCSSDKPKRSHYFHFVQPFLIVRTQGTSFKLFTYSRWNPKSVSQFELGKTGGKEEPIERNQKSLSMISITSQMERLMWLFQSGKTHLWIWLSP